MQEPCHGNVGNILPSRLITTSYEIQNLPEPQHSCQNGSLGGTQR